MGGRRAETERARIDQGCRERRARGDRERRPVPAREKRVEGEDADQRETERVAAMEIRPYEEERRYAEQHADTAGASGEEQIEQEREQREREQMRAVGPHDLGEQQRRAADGDRDDDRRSAPQRDAGEEERGHGDEQPAEDDEAGPSAGEIRDIEDDLTEPFAVRLSVHRAREDIRAQERAVVDHPFARREMPVRIRIARRCRERERERRERDVQRSDRAAVHRFTG